MHFNDLLQTLADHGDLIAEVKNYDKPEWDATVSLLFDFALNHGITWSSPFPEEAEKYAEYLLRNAEIPHELLQKRVIAKALRNEVEEEFRAKTENEMPVTIDEENFYLFSRRFND